MRTKICGRRSLPVLVSIYCLASRRAAGLRAALTASSRSRINASGPVVCPFASFFSLSAGINSSERMGTSRLRPLAHHALPPAFRHQLTALIVGLVQELDDAGIRPRTGFAPRDDLGGRTQRIAMKHGFGELHLAHAEIADRGVKGDDVDRNAE